ncbi:MAG: wax ester/triacylglycerol synthase family O-acyltransferase [Woeseiaceae bacterium]
MHQLSGMDYMFFGFETEDNPSHIAGISICDAATAPGGKLTSAKISKLLRERLKPLPLTRRRIQRVPLNLDYPYWAEDVDFDIDAHIRMLRLPKPGSWDQLTERMSRLVNEPFDENRPLWEICVIQGINKAPDLSPGSFALVLRMHHVFADAATSMIINDVMYDDSSFDPAEAEEIPEPPDKLQMLAAAANNSVRRSFGTGIKAIKATPSVARYLSETISRSIREREMPIGRLNDPKTQLVPDTIGAERSTDACRLDFSRVKAMRQLAEGSTINDLLIAVVGGGIRRYLAKHEEVPHDSLTAIAPINLRQFDDGGEGSNVVSAMMLPLHQDIEDPVERLAAIHAASTSAKRDEVMDVNRSLASIITGLPALVLGPMLGALSGLAHRGSTSFASTIVSNVRSYLEMRTFGGAEVKRAFGIGLLGPGIGSLHACTVYAGHMHIGLTCSPEAIPDTREYMQCIKESFAEYEALVA